MCDTLTTHEGAELTCVDEVRRYGIAVPDGIDGGRCLCSLELEEVLAGHPSAWKRQGWWDGFAEVGPDGRTWFEGYDANTERDGVIHMGRSDGRSAKTIEQIEEERHATCTLHGSGHHQGGDHHGVARRHGAVRADKALNPATLARVAEARLGRLRIGRRR